MKKLCVIPARGGSKRIPRKNIKSFHGQPMISYSIRAARECGLFDTIIVSTDDEEIAEVARAHGAATPFVRPADLANDYAGTGAVVVHAIQWFRDQGMAYDATCCIYATAPLIDPEKLKEGWARLSEPGRRFAFSVTSFPFPIQRALKQTANGSVDMFWPENLSKRSQDLEPAYHDAAQFYWGWSDAWVNGETAFSPISAPVILPRTHVVDIDTPEDWEVAEVTYRVLKGLA
ncbi:MULTISPECIES: pseudaminic acid cytidylyltransferase [Asticcacaulis]|uniref:pseudaminic acid cytidylyltransferase n=1 Tax=Asticcacaulis TaxID=76890 RepID=UPI001AE38616|nr:pseudaminic acid cytidylyltransferase [Asticcacaulis sp. BE141]MBP2160962.1 N-acylneuraminate cytidylyltransferase [Asticcacaulis solisilvae]MDR6802007.1 N-acylneuraminate cytidylyltransferase [Asticcacaulis sp. BE141]